MRSLNLGVILFFAAALAFTQPPPTAGSESRQDQIERRMSNLGILDKIVRDEAARDKERNAKSRLHRPILTKDLIREMEVNETLLNGFQLLLSAEGTGVVKLLNFQDCGKKRDSSGRAKCLQDNVNIREFANSFSFRESKRSVFARSDLSIFGGYLVTGRHSVQTLIVDLGDIPLEQIGLDTDGIGYLIDFVPGESEDTIDSEYDFISNGVTVVSYKDWGKNRRFNYGKLARLADETAYAVRAISYRPEGSEALPKDQDVIVAFRVVDVDKNSAATIVWKELRRTTGKVMMAAPDSTYEQ